MHKNKCLLFVLLFFFLLPFPGEATSSLVEWTFPNNPDNSQADTGTPENLHQELTLIGASTPTYNNTGASTFAARAIGWQSGALLKYWQIQVDTRGYENLTLSAKQRSSTTGPRDFVIEYKTSPEDSWKPLPSGIVTVADDFTKGTLETLALPLECADKERVFIRFLMATNTSVAGTSVTSTGSSRIDDIVLLGSLIGETDDDISVTPTCPKYSSAIHFNEIFPYAPTGITEYVELINQDTSCIDISGWRIEDEGHHKYIFPSGTLSPSGEILSFFKNFYMNNTSGDTLYLFDATNTLLESVHYDHAIKDLSYSFDGTDWQFTSFLTPGSQNIFDEIPDEEPPSGDTPPSLRLNEVLANPQGDEAKGEYIEIYNPHDTAVPLAGWILQDASNKRYIFDDNQTIEPLGYFTIYRSLFSFSLNNVGTETITLLNSLGETVDSLEYDNPPEGHSYSFDSKKWRYTSLLTPDKENKFNKEAKILIKSKKSGFPGTPILFQAELKKHSPHKKYSYHWDFGDGHGSALEQPQHTYQKKGKYTVTVRIKNQSIITEKTFSLTIRPYPKTSLMISALLPNPTGKDAGAEWLEIQNSGQKSIDLKNWKIAIGEDAESLVNHVVTKTTLIPSQSTLKLTHDDASFSLHNKRSLIELRSPDNKPVAQVSYQEEKIKEDTICHTTNNICSFPLTPNNSPKEKASSTKTSSIPALPEKDPSSALTEITSPQESFTPDSKQILLRRITTDMNTLLRLYFEEWVK